MTTIKKVLSVKDKKHIVTDVLHDLPEWFGLPESTQNYIDESEFLDLYVLEIEQMVCGFITLRETSKDTVEIHCMGIKKAFHRHGYGQALLNHVVNDLDASYSFLQVKTVDEGHYKEYDQTIQFYEAMGFKRLEVFPNLWDEWNPCLLLVKSLKEK